MEPVLFNGKPLTDADREAIRAKREAFEDYLRKATPEGRDAELAKALRTL